MQTIGNTILNLAYSDKVIMQLIAQEFVRYSVFAGSGILSAKSRSGKFFAILHISFICLLKLGAIGYIIFDWSRFSHLSLLHPVVIIYVLGIILVSLTFGCVYVIISKKSKFRELFEIKNASVELNNGKNLKLSCHLAVFCVYSTMLLSAVPRFFIEWNAGSPLRTILCLHQFWHFSL